MILVESTSIKAVEHQSALSALKVEFQNGNLYLYHPISKKDYEGFMEAKSKGKHLNEHFRGKGKRIFQ